MQKFVGLEDLNEKAPPRGYLICHWPHMSCPSISLKDLPLASLTAVSRWGKVKYLEFVRQARHGNSGTN